MPERHAGECALYKLRNEARRAHLHQPRHQVQEFRFAERGTHAQDPPGMPQAALVHNVCRKDVRLHGMKFERYGI